MEKCPQCGKVADPDRDQTQVGANYSAIMEICPQVLPSAKEIEYSILSRRERERVRAQLVPILLTVPIIVLIVVLIFRAF